MDTINEELVFKNFTSYFSDIPDPRVIERTDHLLPEILFIGVLATICGADNFVSIEKYGVAKEAWLKTFMLLPNGIPSHDTFNRVFCAINSKDFESRFVSWVRDYYHQLNLKADTDIINIDGKTLRESGNSTTRSKPIHMVSALSVEHGLILGQEKCKEKSNEITAIPVLLNLLDLQGNIVTIDAMGCQKSIASLIIEKQGDYVLALKENQGNLYKEVTGLFDKIEEGSFAHYKHQEDTEWDKGHGRIECRHCITVTKLDWLYEVSAWKNLESIIKITSTVSKGEEKTKENRYYISSMDGNAKQLNQVVRKHWHIENKLHWLLDVAFNEDLCRYLKEKKGHF